MLMAHHRLSALSQKIRNLAGDGAIPHGLLNPTRVHARQPTPLHEQPAVSTARIHDSCTTVDVPAEARHGMESTACAAELLFRPRGIELSALVATNSLCCGMLACCGSFWQRGLLLLMWILKWISCALSTCLHFGSILHPNKGGFRV
jgi:hypothetical protein